MALYGIPFVVTYTAWDTQANTGKTGDVANHSLRWIKDGVASPPANAPVEVDAIEAPGEYSLLISAAEAEATFGKLAGRSSTADVSILGVAVAFENIQQLPVGMLSYGELLRVLEAFLGGTRSGFNVRGASIAVIRDVADTKDVMTVEFDSQRNVVNLTLNP